jgi:hypothetical protein
VIDYLQKHGMGMPVPKPDDVVPYLQSFVIDSFIPREDKAGNIDHAHLFDERPSEKYTWRTKLREQLTPYLQEYPFLNDDVATLSQLDAYLQAPIDRSLLPPQRPLSGVYGYHHDEEWSALADQLRDR